MSEWHIDSRAILDGWSAEFFELMLDARNRRVEAENRQTRSPGTRGATRMGGDEFLNFMGAN